MSYSPPIKETATRLINSVSSFESKTSVLYQDRPSFIYIMWLYWDFLTYCEKHSSALNPGGLKEGGISQPACAKISPNF